MECLLCRLWSVKGERMLGIERRQYILDTLRQERKVYVANLSRDLAVTRETIRRDLEKLEAEGKLLRSHGGAVLPTLSGEDLSFANRAGINLDLKQAIAVKAASLVNDGMSVMADSSSTVLALCHALRGKRDVTIVTNSVRLMHDFAGSDLRLISSGGELRAHSFALVGEPACRTLSLYNVDAAIFSCKGLDIARGVTESNEPEAVIKRCMAEQAKVRILLVDHTKFDQVVFAKAFDWNRVDHVVTDKEPDRRWQAFFRNNGIQVIW